MKIDQPIIISKMAFKLFELYGEPSSKAKYNTCAIEKSTVREIYSNSSLTSSSGEKVRAYLLHNGSPS